MRRAVAQHVAHGPAGLAADLEVLAEAVEERLDFLRRVEAPQDRELRRREAQIFAPRAALSWHDASDRATFPGGQTRRADRRAVAPCGPAWSPARASRAPRHSLACAGAGRLRRSQPASPPLGEAAPSSPQPRAGMYHREIGRASCRESRY